MLNKIRNLLKHKSVNNGIWLYLLQIFNTVLPLLTLPYITRVLGAAEYGVFSIAINIVGYMQVVVEYGFGMSATRKVALNKQHDHISKLFTTVLVSRIILLLFCSVTGFVYFFINQSSPKQGICLIVLLLSLLGYCVQQNWLFQGLQEMKYISIVNIVARTISVILTYALVKSADDLLLYCLLYAIAPCISGGLGFLLAKIKYHVCFVQITLEDLVNELKQGWYIFTTQLSSKVFGAIGITFLGIFSIDSVVGIYSAIQKVPNIMLLIWMPISQVMYPIVSKKMDESFQKGKQYVYRFRKIFIGLFAIAALIVAVFSKTLVAILFGTEYALYFYWILPLLMWMLVSINNNFWGIQILLGSGHDKEYSKCFQIGVVCTIVFNFVLIYFGKGMGAAWAPLLSECILGITLKREINKITE
ncbi:MAG: flippase [Lachnospiraceae bacterium]|nr:flippase [Lachnospiraceae bacterium]MBR4059087.1 flippase [Lachnospiraceae bacterium]